jgi:hypothetical protein
VADDFVILNLGWQMAHPTAHQIENAAACRQTLAIELRQGGNRAVVDMRNKARRGIEHGVVFAIRLAKSAGWKGWAVGHRIDHSARQRRFPPLAGGRQRFPNRLAQSSVD